MAPHSTTLNTPATDTKHYGAGVTEARQSIELLIYTVLWLPYSGRGAPSCKKISRAKKLELRGIFDLEAFHLRYLG